MDYKKLASDLISGCKENCANCEYAGDSEFECTIAQLASTAITDLLACVAVAEKQRDEARQDCAVADRNHMIEVERRKAEEARAEKAEEIASELCDDFTDFVTGGVHNAAPYCANFRPECVNNRGWCNGDNKVCRGFVPKAARIKKEE